MYNGDGADQIKGDAIPMEMLGSQTMPCRELVIPADGKVMFVQAFSEGKKLRALKFHMGDNSEEWFGKFYTAYNAEVVVREYDFLLKKDMLGVYGHTELDSDNS